MPLPQLEAQRPVQNRVIANPTKRAQFLLISLPGRARLVRINYAETRPQHAVAFLRRGSADEIHADAAPCPCGVPPDLAEVSPAGLIEVHNRIPTNATLLKRDETCFQRADVDSHAKASVRWAARFAVAAFIPEHRSPVL